jgi:hypothetical protein
MLAQTEVREKRGGREGCAFACVCVRVRASAGFFSAPFFGDEKRSETRAQPYPSQATGAAVLEALAAQRAAIERSRGRLAAADGDLAASQRLLKRMASWWPFGGG